MSEVSNEEASASKADSKEESNATDEAQKETTKVSSDADSAANQQNKGSSRGANSSKSNVDLVLISDDEGEDRNECGSTPEQLNGQSSPNGIESVDSNDSDGVGMVEDYSEGSDDSDGNDDEIEITGVSMANNELGTVGGMDQLLRTLIEQGWTENEIMQQLRTMIGPYHRRPRLNIFNSLDDVVQCIKRVNKVIVVSGAGISVSCGIPDFRSETGLYARLSKDYPTLPNPTAMFDLHYFLNDPKPFYTFAKELWPGQFKPSPCHRFIKLLESQGKLLRNYTQNIDTLEQVAGIQNVIQCHGSFATASCIYCRFQVSGDVIKSDIMESRAPLCPRCEEKRLVDGPEAFAEFARTHYRDIKKKLRRREKVLCSSSDTYSSDSSFSDSPEAESIRQKKSPGRPAAEAEPSSPKRASGGPSPGGQDEAPSCSSPNRRADAADGSGGEAKKAEEDSEATGTAAGDSGTGKATATPTSKDKPKATSKTDAFSAFMEESSAVTSTTSAPTDEASSSRRMLESLLAGDPEPSSSRGADGPGPSRISPMRRAHAPPKPMRPKRDPLDPLLKPDIVFFGEDLPRTFFEHAEEDLDQAELIIVIGSSMKVKPVASIPEFVRESTPRVLINREPVKHISFDAELLGDADEIVQQLCYRLEWGSPVDAARSDLSRPMRPRVVPLDELAPLPSREDVERSKAGAKVGIVKSAEEGGPGTSGNGEEAKERAENKATEKKETKEEEKEEKKETKEEKEKEEKKETKEEKKETKEEKEKEEKKETKEEEKEEKKETKEEKEKKEKGEQKEEEEKEEAKDLKEKEKKEENEDKKKGDEEEKEKGDKEEKDKKEEKDEKEEKEEKENPMKSERHEFEEPCPLFGSRCRCPMNWNIAHFLPDDAVVKMMPATFIFPGAIMNHPKHVFTALSVADESMNVDSDSDLGGMENPIEVSSSEVESSDGEVEELFDLGSGNNSVCLVNDEANKSGGLQTSEGDSRGASDSDKPAEKTKKVSNRKSDSPMDTADSSPQKATDKKDSCQSSRNQDSAPSQKRPSSVNDDADEPNGKAPRLTAEKSSDNEDCDPNEREPVTEHGDNVDV